MDGGAWRTIVHRVAESVMTERLTVLLQRRWFSALIIRAFITLACFIVS